MDLPSTIEERLYIAAWKLRFFRRYVRRFIGKNFHAVRVLDQSFTQVFSQQKPVIIYSNHSSWWDPMLAIYLADQYAGQRKHYAPIEDVMLERYGIFKKLGFYGVEKDTAAGAKDFLKVSNHLLKDLSSTLWITPQGRFADARERPLELKKGLAQLLKGNSEVNVIPLAIEYTFWTEKKPEVLLSFGQPLELTDSIGRDEIHTDLEFRLESLMTDLAEKSKARDTSAFQTVAAGKSGVGGLYGWVQKLRGYQPDHIE